MKPLKLILFVILLFPVIDFFALFWWDNLFGVWLWWWVVVAMVLGWHLMRKAFSGGFSFQQIQAGKVPSLGGSLSLAFGGFLLLLPGLMSDVLALLILLPQLLGRKPITPPAGAHPFGFDPFAKGATQQDGDIVDAEYHEVPERDNPKRLP